MLSSRSPLTPMTPFAAGFATLFLATGALAGEKYAPQTTFTDEDAAHVKELFQRVVSTGESDCCKAAAAVEVAAQKTEGQCSSAVVACDHEEPWEQLSKTLTWKPAAWDVVKPLALARFEGEAPAAERANVLSLLAWQYSEPAVTLASEIAEAHPDTAFSEDQVIAFAEAGSKRFWHRAADLQKAGDSVNPAALLALHGMEADTAVLRAAVAQPLDVARPTRTFVAALALKRLGQPEYMEQARADLRSATLRALDEGDVNEAARLALTGEFLHEACSSYKAVRLSFLDMRLAWHCRERAQELRSADDVFALVEHLSAL